MSTIHELVQALDDEFRFCRMRFAISVNLAKYVDALRNICSRVYDRIHPTVLSFLLGIVVDVTKWMIDRANQIKMAWSN
jgi:hypothetical protein